MKTISELRCPICHQDLHDTGKGLECPEGHNWSMARQGYVNLCRKQSPSGDNKEMVQARTRFLEKGYYDFLRDKLCQLTQNQDVLLDVGCGQGHYTKTFPAHKKYGLDLSKEAVKYAAAQDKETTYLIGSMHDLPFKDQSVDVVTSIFTPLAEREIRRVLKPGGLLIQVQPAPDHLHQLKAVLYETVKPNPLPGDTLEGFELADRLFLSETQHVDNVWDLLEMTPYRYRTGKAGLDAAKALECLDVTFGFVLSIWKRK